jgi:hypothetical protein
MNSGLSAGIRNIFPLKTFPWLQFPNPFQTILADIKSLGDMPTGQAYFRFLPITYEAAHGNPPFQ